MNEYEIKITYSGHKWGNDGEKCVLCGDKDWRADKYCSKNPSVKEAFEEWVKQVREENQQNNKNENCASD